MLLTVKKILAMNQPLQVKKYGPLIELDTDKHTQYRWMIAYQLFLSLL